MRRSLGIAFLCGALAAQAGLKDGDEFAVSFWFAPEEIREGAVAYGFAMRKPSYTEAPMNFWLSTLRGPNGEEPVRLGGCMEGDFPLGERHHLAMRHSLKEGVLEFWLDGRLQLRKRLEGAAARRIDAAKLELDETRREEVSDCRVYETAVPAERLLAFRPAAADVTATAEAFAAAASGTKAPSLKRYFEAKARKAKDLAGGGTVGAWMELRNLTHLVDRLIEWSEPQAADGFAQLPFACVAIDPYFNGKHVTYRAPDDGAPFGGLQLTAAKGEVEAGSFMVLPFESGRKVEIRPTELRGAAGTIPASAVDVRIVVCWYGVFWGWDNFYASWRGWGALQPELLVHDDRLVVVDEEKRTNFLRLSYPDGERYVDVSSEAKWDDSERFNYNLEPVRDAESFRPFETVEGKWRQLWITAKVPADAKGGLYEGALEVSVDGERRGAIPLKLEVLPFRLPRASTRYDIDRPMLATWMHHGDLTVKTRGDRNRILGGFSLSNAVRRLGAEFRNMAEHNMLNPWTMSYGNAADDDLSDLQLDLIRNAGLELDPIFGDVGVEWHFASQMKKAFADNRTEWAQSMTDYSNRVARAAAKLREKVGHSRTYGYAMDEAWTEVVLRELGYFATINHFGGGAFTTSGRHAAAGFMIDVNDSPEGISSVEARHWHNCGARCVSYASPFSGPENADTWRRGKGIRLYMANFDGINEYEWYEGYHIWNDFIPDPYGAQYKNFCIVYPTADGVLDTIAWESLREGFDDIRYLTLLRRIARKAIASGNPVFVAAGKTAVGWAESIEPERVSPVSVRAGCVERILSLAKLLKRGGIKVGDVIGGTSPLAAVPIVLPQASSEASADAYAQRGLCDIARAYYDAHGLPLKSAEMSLKLRDRQAVEAALARAKDSPERTALEVRLALMSERHGWKPEAEAMRAVAKKAGGLPEKLLAALRPALLGRLVEAGCFEEAIQMGKPMMDKPHAYSNPDKIAFATSAGDAAKALKRWPEAVAFYEFAAKWSGWKPEPLMRLADAALGGGNWKLAEKHYADAVKKLDPSSRKADIEAIKKKLLDLHKRDAKPTLKPAEKDEITLDEEDE